MAARALMFQGTGSDVGKSLIVAGLCRLLSRRGVRVAPFKAQNMSNNAAVTPDGGEIGRAQWLQALAAGIEPSVHMNPILLKPQSNKTSQVIVHGKLQCTLAAKEYHQVREQFMPRVLESYYALAKDADIILVEGAGSPAEINLRANDIANMGFARATDCPVILIGDIDRGGVIASLVGTYTVLSEEDKAMICGFIINKFRGDARLFDDGTKAIAGMTGWPYLGLIPHYPALTQLPQEDSMALHTPHVTRGKSAVTIAVLSYPNIANFDDIDPLANEQSVKLIWCKEGDIIPDADTILLPGSKATMADLAFVKTQGWDIDLKAHYRRGGRIIGLCGGYQMLGKTLSDPNGVEGAPATVEGLGLLNISTLFTTKKTVTPWQGKYGSIDVTGYEIHLGESDGDDCQRPLFTSNKGSEGARSPDDRIWGSYIHGIFANDTFRKQFLLQLGAPPSSYHYVQHMQEILNGWSDILESHIDIEQLMWLTRPVKA